MAKEVSHEDLVARPHAAPLHHRAAPPAPVIAPGQGWLRIGQAAAGDGA